MMKKFILTVCGSLVGAFLALVVFGLCAVAVSFSIMAAFAKSEVQSIQDHSMLYIKLSGPIAERSADASAAASVMAMVQGQNGTSSLSDMVKAIEVAKTEKKIKGIYLDCQGAQASAATMRSLRNALLDFKASSHKPVIAYGYQGYSQGDYYVATVADSVLLNPVGAVDVHGLAAVTPYFKTLLDKVGVKMQILRVGTYKSAVEPFMLDSISPANREQQSLFLGNVWRVMAGEMARSRDIAPAQFNAMADSLMLTMTAPALKASKLIDGTCYKPEMEDKIRRIAGLEQDDDLRLASPELVASHYDNGSNKDGIVAVVYAVGEIDGSDGPMADGENIDSEKLVATIEELRNDDDVKGLVLRVNSPGGSAFGSEQIWRALEQFKRAGKIFAVSMGDYAASGGYYISCGAQRIFADSTTITGSIGIFGMIPCAQELIENKLGVHMGVVKTNANADMATDYGIVSKAMTPVQLAAMQNYINRGYDLFTQRVASGRGVSQDSIKKIAQGRVWDGISARRIGLVDQFGSLADAVDWVAKKASLNTGYYEVKEYPDLEVDLRAMLSSLYGMKQQERLAQSMGMFYTYYRQLEAMAGRRHVLCLMPPIEVK
jgi:signal peptide peptidase sppA, 67K type